jgi:acyl carrier protein
MTLDDSDLACVLEIVRSQIAEGAALPRDVQVGPDSRAGSTPGWDSISMVNILFKAEEVFGVEFTSQQMEQVRGVADLRAAIAWAQRARRSAQSVTA